MHFITEWFGTSLKEDDGILIEQDITLYAQWRPLNSYSISYNANGGEGFIDTVYRYEDESSIIANASNLSRKGYVFVGWNTANDGSGTGYEPSASYSENLDLMLYAQWDIVKYSIQYDLNGGTIIEGSNPIEYTVETDTFTLLNPEKEGFKFLGWEDLDMQDKTFEEMVSITKGSAGNRSFKAQWQQLKKCTIVFDSNGADYGLVPASLSVWEGEQFRVPLCDSLAKDDYLFQAWNDKQDGSGTFYWEFQLSSVDKDVTLYAVWLESPLIYTYLEESNSYSVELKGGSYFQFENNINIPSEYKGKPITHISDGGFCNRDIYNRITIPLSVTHIGNYAFIHSDNWICVIEIPASVKSIGSNAFSSRRYVQEIVIPSSVTTIGDRAFSNCTSLRRIELSSCLTSIEDELFAGCYSLTSIVIPSSVTRIGKSVFVECSSLSDIRYDGSMSDWKTKISKDSTWNYHYGNCIIHCTDGDVFVESCEP